MTDDMKGPPPGEGMFDAKGRWVPERLIKPIDRARHDLVLELAKREQEHVDATHAHERRQVEDIAAFVSLSAEQYGVPRGGRRGGVSLTSYDGRFRVVHSFQDQIQLDERITIAKGLIDGFIKDQLPGSSDEIRALVDHAFEVESGRVSVGRILSLRKIAIDHPTWKQAMQAIADSVHVASTRSYVRVYERVADTETYQPLRPRGAQ